MTVQSVLEQNILTVRCDGRLIDNAEADTCVADCMAGDKNIALCVLDFSTVQKISGGALKLLSKLGAQFKAEGRRLVLLAHQDLAEIVAVSGLEKDIQCFIRSVPILEEKNFSFPISKHEEVLMFCRILSASAARTLRFYSGAEVTVQSPALLTPISGRHPKIDVAGVVTLLIPQFEGHMTLGFPKGVIEDLLPKTGAAKMSDRASLDWAAELLNISFGHFKTALNSQGYNFNPAIPTLIRDSEIEMTHPEGAVAAVAELNFGDGRCYVQVSRAGPQTPKKG